MTLYVALTLLGLVALVMTGMAQPARAPVLARRRRR